VSGQTLDRVYERRNTVNRFFRAVAFLPQSGERKTVTGAYAQDRAPILFMMEEFSTLGHTEIMERAALSIAFLTLCRIGVALSGSVAEPSQRSSWTTSANRSLSRVRLPRRARARFLSERKTQAECR
jgi:hypothetical protein